MIVRFSNFEVDLRAGEARKGRTKLKLSGQPFQVLAILLEQPGQIVKREVLQKRLWPDTFVDVDHSPNTAINKIREVLGDTAVNPRFVETLPRRGYRFIAQVNGAGQIEVNRVHSARWQRWRILAAAFLFCALVLLAGLGWTLYEHTRHSLRAQRVLTRLTFDEGLQIGATWSPDGRYIAYASDRGGKFDIWVQQVSGGDAVQVTKGRGQRWQPDWSPDGKYIAYRSENGDGGLYIVPALGGAGLERKLASFGYFPRWSPDSSRILFQSNEAPVGTNGFYLMTIDGNAPREVGTGLLTNQKTRGVSAAWNPDGKRISAWVRDLANAPSPAPPSFGTVSVDGAMPVQSNTPDELLKQFKQLQETLGSPNGDSISDSPGFLPARPSILREPFKVRRISGG
jgi:DNA-binding winged helix-turn-helix (wHTH) protein